MKQRRNTRLLLVVLLLFPIAALAQISAYSDLAFKIPNLTTDKYNHFVRVVDSTRHITLGVNDHAHCVFTDCRANAPYFFQVEMPHTCIVNDFQVVGDQVVFCGYEVGTDPIYSGMIGRFTLPNTWTVGATPVEFCCDRSDIIAFNRMTAYLYDNGTGDALYVATEGIKGDGTQAMATVRSPLAGGPFVDYYLWGTSSSGGTVRFDDITSTDECVARVGYYYLSSSNEGLTIYRYKKSDIANLTGLFTQGRCRYVYSVEQVRATHSTGNDLILAALWHNLSWDYSIFYQTLDLSTFVSPRGQYHLVGGGNTQLREMTYLKEPGKVVSIVEHPLGVTRHLVFDPYSGPEVGGQKLVSSYGMTGLDFNSIDKINDRYAISFDGIVSLVKGIDANYLHRPSLCVQMADTLDINLNRTFYETMQLRDTSGVTPSDTLRYCPTYKVEPSLVCKTNKD